MFKDFFKAIINPQRLLQYQISNESLSRKTLNYIGILILTYIGFISLFVAFSIAVEYIKVYVDIDQANKLTQEFTSLAEEGNATNTIIIMIVLSLFSVVHAPIVEEITFRAHLYATRRNIALSLSGVLYFIFLLLVDNGMGNSQSDIQAVWILIQYLVSIIFSILSYFLFRFILAHDSVYQKVLHIYTKHFNIMFWGWAVLAFAFVHITNYDLPIVWKLILIPLLTLPQLYLGYALAYVRMRFGLKWSIILHSLHNGVICFFFIFVMIITATYGRS